MNKLEQLIVELCPDGVEYKLLGEIATDMYRGAGIKRDEITDEGTPCVRYGEIYTSYNLWFDECISHTKSGVKTFSYGDILFAITGESVEEIAKSCAYMGEEECYAGGDIVVMKHKQNPKYIAYALSTTGVQVQKSNGRVKSKVVHTNIPALKEVIIPLPPLPVQQEIVRILDTFTQMEAELETELEAELKARKKQYEYYRNELLTFGDDVPMVPLGTVAINLDAKRRPVTKGKRTIGKYPYYGASGIVDYVNDYIFDGDYLLVSEDGANLVARVTPIAFTASGKIWVNNHAHILEFSTYFERKFIEYYLNMIDLGRYISVAAQPKLTQDNLNKILVPHLSQIEQARIVAILDRFDALVNDISQGLPAEIDARRKQYEYYRDKLLTFKEKVS